MHVWHTDVLVHLAQLVRQFRQELPVNVYPVRQEIQIEEEVHSTQGEMQAEQLPLAK